MCALQLFLRPYQDWTKNVAVAGQRAVGTLRQNHAQRPLVARREKKNEELVMVAVV